MQRTSVRTRTFCVCRLLAFAGVPILLTGCRSGTEVDDGGESPSTVRITAPATAVIGDTIRATAVALNRGGRELTNVSPTVAVTIRGTAARLLPDGAALATDTGTVTIVGATGSVRSEQRVTVGMPASLSVSFTGPDTVSVGDTLRVPSAEIRRDDVVRPDLAVRLISSDTTILLVVVTSGRSVLRPVAAGRVMLTAALGARSATRVITVTPPRVQTITFVPTPTVADVGDIVGLRTVAFDALGSFIGPDEVRYAVVRGPGTLEGVNTVKATGVGQVVISATVRDRVVFDTLEVMPPSQFTLTLRPGVFSDGTVSRISPKLQAALDRAVKRWRQVIREDLPSAALVLEANRCRNPAVNESVAGVLVHVRMSPLGSNGPLAGANACVLRPDSRPIAGVMEFNSDIIESLSDDELFYVATHELGHVLGIGSLWYRADGLPSLVSRAGTTAIFVGPRALAEFDLLQNRRTYTGPAIPLARDGGHWDNRILQSELMEPFASANTRFSRLTVGAMADMGYLVNPRSWDRYAMPLPALSSVLSARAFNLSGDVLPPFGVVQADGRVLPLR